MIAITLMDEEKSCPLCGKPANKKLTVNPAQGDPYSDYMCDSCIAEMTIDLVRLVRPDLLFQPQPEQASKEEKSYFKKRSK